MRNSNTEGHSSNVPLPQSSAMVRPAGQVSDPARWYGSGARSSPVGSPVRSAARIGEEALAAVRGALLGHGIDTSVPVAGHTGSKVRLPLHYFDNHDLERHEPDTWVELANERFGRRANAAVLITDESGVGTWRLGRVFQWDAAAGQFYAHLLGAGGRVAEDSSVVVQRLSCMFLLERCAPRAAAAELACPRPALRSAAPTRRAGRRSSPRASPLPTARATSARRTCSSSSTSRTCPRPTCTRSASGRRAPRVASDVGPRARRVHRGLASSSRRRALA